MHVPRKYRKLFQDAIVVNIPLDVTADLGVAIQRTRAKRIQAIHKNFPSLKPTETTTPEEEQQLEEEAVDEDDDNENDKPRAAAVPPQKKQLTTTSSSSSKNVPHRNQYGSIVDYMEAKYARGVMVPDDGGSEEADDRVSVYSEDSWIDDSMLKRDVAEQVLSHSTQTKVMGDDNFFVNVGNLEVTEEMDYDPAEEEKVMKKAKRKRSTDGSAKKKSKTDDSDNKSVKKKATTTTPKSSEGKKTTPKKKTTSNEKVELSNEDKDKLQELKKKADEKKAAQKQVYERLLLATEALTEKALPRRHETSKVSIVVTEGKKPGDTMTFSNPHVPGQRCRVKVPKNVAAGDKFVVSVPAPVVSDDKDRNKFPKEYQNLLDEYSVAFDDWCQADSKYRDAAPEKDKKYSLLKAKLAKFDQLLEEFPKNLISPVDAPYLRKIVRRVRQYRHKKEQTAAKANAAEGAPPVKEEPQEDTSTIDMTVPQKGRVFDKRQFDASDFGD